MKQTILIFIIGILLQSCTNDVKTIISDSEKASFIIYTYDEYGSPSGSGSGFFIEQTGEGITNYHVLNGATKAILVRSDSSKYEIEKIISGNSKIDLVKFKVKNPDKITFPILTFAASMPEKGDKVYCLSNPLGLESSFSEGIISAIRTEKVRGKTIQFSAPISPGSSGGAIINSEGQVVGMATYYKRGGQNLNFGISLNEDIIKSIKDDDFSKYNPRFSLGDKFIILNQKSDDNPFEVLNAIEFGQDGTTIYASLYNLQLSDGKWALTHELNKKEKGNTLINHDENTKYFIKASTISTDKEKGTELIIGTCLKYKMFFPKTESSIKKISLVGPPNDGSWSNIKLQEFKDIQKFDINKYEQILAFSLLKVGDLESALGVFQDIIDEDPNNVEALNAAGVLSYTFDNNNDAEIYFSRAIEASPTFFTSFVNRHYVYIKQNKFNLAIDDISKAIDLKSTQPAFYFNRGDIYKLIGDEEKYYKDLTKGLEVYKTVYKD